MKKSLIPLAAFALYSNVAIGNQSTAVCMTAVDDTIHSPTQSYRTDSALHPNTFHQIFLQEAYQKNRPGTQAANFVYLNHKGKPTTLYRTKGKSLLLIFYDPDCQHCMEVIDTLNSNALLLHQIQKKELTVLAIYADGDLDVWKRNKCKLPTNWKVGFATGEIFDRELYILPEMPTIYLLDKNKMVLLKDASAETLINKLRK